MLLLPSTFLENFENNLNFVLKAKNVNYTHMTNLYNNMFAFLRDYPNIGEKEACHFIHCTVKYIECISCYVDSSEQDNSAVKHFCKIIGVIPRLPAVQYTYLQEISKIILEKVIELVEPTWFVKELLVHFNTALKYFDRDSLHRFISNNIFSLYKLSDVLNLCGDYNYQVKILETIFYMCSANQINEYSSNCFPESIVLQNAFQRIQSDNFNLDVRRFLNLINCKSTSVVSVKCEHVMLDAIWVDPPKGCAGSELWVDFNRGPNTISILCDVDSLRTPLSSSDSSNRKLWELITVNAADVQNVLLSKWLDENFPTSRGAIVCFKLTKPCSVTYASSQQAAQSKQLKLAILNGSALERLEKYVFPKMFMENFKRVSPPSTVVQQLQQRLSVVEANRKYVIDHQMSVAAHKRPVLLLGQYGLNSMSFESAVDEHLDELDEGALRSPSCSDFKHRAKPNNSRTLTHISLLDDEKSEDSDYSVASTHLTNCVLDYIDLTSDDETVKYSSSQTSIQSSQNNRIATAVDSEKYYSIPADHTVVAVIDLTTCSSPNECVQSQYFTANEAITSQSQGLQPVTVENASLKKLSNMTEDKENEVEFILDTTTIDAAVELTYSNSNAPVESQSNRLNSQYFTANETMLTGNTFSLPDHYLQPVIVENRPLKKLLSIIQEEEENQVELILPLNEAIDCIEHEPVANDVQHQPHEMNKTFLKISPSATEKAQSKQVLISVGKVSENIPKETLKKKVMKKKSRSSIKNVKNQRNNHKDNEAESSEGILNQLLLSFEKATPELPKVEELEINTSQGDRVHIGSSESTNKESLPQCQRSIRKKHKTKKRSENQTSTEVTARKLFLLSKQPQLVLHRLVQEEVSVENHVDEELQQVQKIEDHVVLMSKDLEKNSLQKKSSITENFQSISFEGKNGQMEMTQQNIDSALTQKQHQKKIEDEIPDLVADANQDEEDTESILVNSEVNTKEEAAKENREDVSTEPVLNVAVKKSPAEGYEKECKESKDTRLGTTNIKNQQCEYAQDIEEIQEASGIHGENEQEEFSKMLRDLHSSGDQSHQEKNTNDFLEPLSDALQSKDLEDQNHSENLIDPTNTNKILKPLNNIEEVSTNDSGKNSHLEENVSILKQNLNERNQCDIAEKEIQTEAPQKFNKVLIVRVARLNVIKDCKTGICLIENTQKHHKLDQFEKTEQISNINEPKQHGRDNNGSMILTPNNDENHIKVGKTYDINTEVILSQSRKYKKRSYLKSQNKENVEPPRKRKLLDVRKLYNPNDLSYTKLYTEQDFNEATSSYFKSMVEDAQESKSPINLQIKEDLAKKSTMKKGEHAKLSRKVREEKQNDTFRWKLKKLAKEDEEAKMINNHGTKKRTSKEDKVVRDEYDNISGKEKQDKQRSTRKRKKDAIVVKNSLGSTMQKDEELDSFDKILTKGERDKSRKLAREKLTNSRKSIYSVTNQSAVTSKSRNDIDISSVLSIFEKTIHFDRTFNTNNTSNNRHKSVKNNRRKKYKKSKTFDYTHVMRTKDSLDGYESLYSDVENFKSAITQKKSFNINEKESKRRRYNEILPLSSKKPNTELSQKKQNLNNSSPLPELNFENEMQPLKIGLEPRRTSSSSTLLQKTPVEPVEPPKINILSNIILKTASNNNTGSVHSSTLLQKTPVESVEPPKINILSNIIVKTASNNSTGSTSSVNKIRPTKEDISSWVSTGLPEETAKVVKSTMEVVMHLFWNMIKELLQVIRGPVPSDLIKFYELLIKWDNDLNNYFNQH